MVEVLAPAGNKESFFSAISSGANAIYLGLNDFSARKSAENFTLENLSFYLSYAHLYGVKVYLAVNTIIKDNELDNFYNSIYKAYEMGVDAFILQDLFLVNKLKSLCHDINLHLSTQAGVCNEEFAKTAKRLGFNRVILSRETPLNEIKKITKIIETECFVHGAMCTCMSGHCYFSSFVGGNSGNRGFCKQPCRKKYKYASQNEFNYALSLADLDLSSEISTLISAGVSSFKIEGRMRRAEYVASSVKLIKNSINKQQKEDLEEAKRLFNRGDFTKGYLFGQDKNLISSKIQGHKGSFIGRVQSIIKDKIVVASTYKCKEKDAFKIIRNGYEVGNGIVNFVENRKDAFVANFKGKVMVNDEVYVTTDNALLEKLQPKIDKIKVNLNVYGQKDDYLTIKLVIQGKEFAVKSDILLTQSVSSPLTCEKIREVLAKTDKYPFEIESLECDIVEDLFFPNSKLNELRRELYLKSFEFFSNKIDNKCSMKSILHTSMCDIERPKNSSYNQKILILDNFRSVSLENIDKIVFTPFDYNDDNEFKEFFNSISTYGGEKYLFAPAFLTSEDIEILFTRLKGFDGVYADSVLLCDFAKQRGYKFILSDECNLFNCEDANFSNFDADFAVLSKELSEKELDFIVNSTKNQLFKYSLGRIKLMNLTYCPFGKICKSCNMNKFTTLTDENGRKYLVRRYKLSSCRFEIYNNASLLSTLSFKIGNVVNLVGFEGDKVNLVMSNLDNKDKLKEIFVSYTYGNYKNGVN